LRKPILQLAVTIGLAIAAAMMVNQSQAAVIRSPRGLRLEIDQLKVIETAQFFWGGRRYCWYYNGWRGPGWYQCGYHWRRGFGWGGPVGWHGWRRPPVVVRPPVHRPGVRPPVHRPGVRPPVHRPGVRPPVHRPGVTRPGGNRPGVNRPGGNRPGVNRPGGGRPSAGRPGGGGGGRSGGNRAGSR